MRKKTFHLLLFSLGLLFFSCYHNSKPLNLDSWSGNYFYEEEPIKANAGYAMVMEWSLSITKQPDSCTGILEVNGQQTNIKLLTDISGDTNAIAITYHSIIDGSDEGFKLGDTLFIFSRIGDRLVTKWKMLAPRLSLLHPKECNCFTEVSLRP